MALQCQLYGLIFASLREPEISLVVRGFETEWENGYVISGWLRQSSSVGKGLRVDRVTTAGSYRRADYFVSLDALRLSFGRSGTQQAYEGLR